MVLKVEIQKLKNTCIMLDSVLFKPVETKDNVDYYELPCELQKNYDIKIIHYAGNSFNGIESVIDRNEKGAFKSIISEMKSFNIDLYYCEMIASFTVTKQNAFICFETEQIENKDFIGKSSHSIFKIKQRVNVQISNSAMHCYPSKRVKYSVFLIEILSTILELFIFLIVIMLAIDNYVQIEIRNGNEVGLYPYVAFIPFAIVCIILLILEIRRVIKRTLRID